MSFVTSSELQREGAAVNSEVLSLDEAVDRAFQGKQPFPDGPWWQRWKGFRGSWSQYYEEQIKPTPLLPFHDDGDVQNWSKELGAWKGEFSKGQAANSVKDLGGPITGPPIAPNGGSSTVPTTLKALAALAGLGAVGYFLANVASVKRAFS
jgi:hypothetical protein